MAFGDLSAVIDSWEYDTVQGIRPHILKIADEVYGVVYSGSGPTGQLKTIEIKDDGTITKTPIDSWQFDGSAGDYPFIMRVGPQTYAIVYQTVSFLGNVGTVTIADDGTITKSWIDIWTLPASLCRHPQLLTIAGAIRMVSWMIGGNDGAFSTFNITTGGLITKSLIDTYTFEPGGDYTYPEAMLLESVEYYAAFYQYSTVLRCRTVRVKTNGDIVTPYVESQDLANITGSKSHAARVAGDIYVVVYTGAGNDGFLRTYDIDGVGDITMPHIDEYEFDTDYCNWPEILLLANKIFLIVYQGPDGDGWACTVQIEDDGTIGTVLSTLEFDTADCIHPVPFHIAGDVYGVIYEGTGNDGFIKTFSAETVTGGGHEMFMGIGP